ncbi:hypothetical protein OH77DRAFT_1435406 [Trametes cingulata]|nr:hypothetical protein OH77DRAFT_1435406 [Trametes cingulata]
MTLPPLKGRFLSSCVSPLASASYSCHPSIKGHYRPLPPPDVKPFLPLFKQMMPLLEDFLLSRYFTSVEDRGYRILVSPTADHFPSLRRLTLACVTLPWSSTTLSRLTRLRLRLSLVQGAPVRQSQFLDVLQSCSELEDLELSDNFISSALDRYTPTSATGGGQIVELPKLRKLKVEDTPPVIRWFLGATRIHEHCSIEARGCLPRETGPESMQGIFSSMDPTIGNAPGELRVPTPRHGRIEANLSMLELALYSTEGSLVLQVVQEGGFPDGDADFYLDAMLREFADLFGSTFEIECCEIRGDLEDVRFDTYLYLLSRLPALEELAFIGNGPCTPFLRALKHTPVPVRNRALNDYMDGEDNDPEPTPPPCPKLTSLHLCTEESYEEGAIELLLTVLHRRAFHNSPKMVRTGLYYACDETYKRYQYDVDLFRREVSSHTAHFYWTYWNGHDYGERYFNPKTSIFH